MKCRYCKRILAESPRVTVTYHEFGDSHSNEFCNLECFTTHNLVNRWGVPLDIAIEIRHGRWERE